jgi:ubiquinone/menaquinone biosynthesis C-methylase UbiE
VDWRDRYYERGYLKRWRLSPPDEARSERAAQLLALADVPPTARVLDLGCGHGADALALAERGAEVVALDASNALLARAQAHARGRSYSVHWVRGDMGAIPFTRHFDVVLILSAFGYFEMKEKDAGLLLLREVARVLRAEGRLVLGNPNATRIRSDFKTFIREERNGRTIDLYSTLDEKGHWLDQRVVIGDHEGIEEYHRRQRLFSADELEGLLHEAGFIGVKHFSSSEGAPFDRHVSPSLITVCQTASAGRDA